MYPEETTDDLFFVQKDNVYLLPVLHYNMETAALVRRTFQHLKPDCVAVELAETMQLQLLHAASRLPDISVAITYNKAMNPIYYLCEPCDPAFEGLRSALEAQVRCFCIDLDIDGYPDINENLPDPYAISRIGLKNYYEIYRQTTGHSIPSELDLMRELYMAKRLKELSLSHERVLFIGGMSHIHNIAQFISHASYPSLNHVQRDVVELCTLTEQSCRDVLAEFGYVSMHYEAKRAAAELHLLDRQKLFYQLYKDASINYIKETGNNFPGYNMRNLMKFTRNYSIVTGRLMPNLFQILSAAKGCVDHNFAYEVWQLATSYEYLRNVDNLTELDASIDDIWGRSKLIQFHLKQPGRKNNYSERIKKDKGRYRFKPPGMFSICSYPPEDVIIERFGGFLKKKGTQILSEESSRTIPFSTSLEDGIDTRESIRHWHEKKLYVKTKGKPPGGVGSVVMIFDEDHNENKPLSNEKYPWRTTWIGEHNQESDMAFYATHIAENMVGPGISKCEYGGFMMSYPPRRVFDVWSDPDYHECRSKAEVLLMSAIDYALKPLIVYVAAKPPRSWMKSFARRFGKKIIYMPIGQLSPVTLNKLRTFHVLDGRDKREIADEYIF